MIAQPPQPPPALKVGRRSHFRFVLGAVACALLGVIVLGALGFFVTDDLGQRTTVHKLGDQVTSVRGSLASAEADASAQAAAEQDEISGLQSQITTLQSQNASLQSQIPSQPDFVVVGTGWNGSCDLYGCYPDATFANHGQAGEAVALFEVFPSDSTSGTPLAKCSAAIPLTPANGSADAGCTASGTALSKYSAGSVTFTVTVTNP